MADHETRLHTIARYMGPQSPWGPGVSGIVTAIALIAGFGLAAPPVYWALVKWWRIWL